MSDSPGGGHPNDQYNLAFDPSGSNLPPPLRPPLLSQSQLQAALQLGFSDKCIPAGGVGNGRGNPPYYQPPSDFGSNYSQGGGGGPEYFEGNQYPQQQQGDCVDGGRGHYSQETEQEGLLPHLRRPDVNQIPPDVLAVLIKTGRFQEILGQDQRQQQGQPHPTHSIPDSQGNQDPRMSTRNNNPNNRQSPSQHQQHERNYSSTSPQQQSQTQERNYSPNSPHQQPQVQEQRHYIPPHQQQRQSQDSRYSGNSPQQRPSHTQDRNNYSGPPQRHPNQQQRTPPTGGSQPTGPPQQRFRPPAPAHLSQGTKLSPLAKEFRPTAPQGNAAMMNFQEESELAQAVAQIQMLSNHNQAAPLDFCQGPYSSQPGNEIDNNSDNMECILSTVTEAITDLTLHPANFSRSAKTITEVLKNYLNDTDTLQVVVTLLVEQSISNPNFCYSGARLSQVLHKSGIAVGSATFKNFLLAQCQQEFNQCVANMENNPDIHYRCRGLLMFFGELFVNIKMEKTDGTAIPISVFGLGVIEMMQRLIKEKEPSHENVKCVFQVLKLVGWELENSTHAKTKEEFEKLVKDLSYLNCTSKGIKPQTKLLLEALFELMGKKWNRVESSEESTKTPVSSPSSVSSNYGSNYVYEMPESDEEDYDESGLMLDDEPPEVQKAFDEFLKMGKRK